MALIAGCSVSALPASSPKPLTRFQTPAGRPASSAISIRMRAVSGENSAGLWTTVQPAASAGAIFQVDSMKGVFHGVMMPTGPIGTRVVMFINVGDGSVWPSRADGARSPKKRKFSAPRSAALDMKRNAWPVSQHSAIAISSARATMRSAIRCRIFLRFAASRSRQAGKAALAACAAASISAAPLLATVQMKLSSTGE